ncbi:diacylglycerol kinase family protein [Paludicola sp. MB14-C6]|uniref:diacylglycerol kinase family protein n=1 Tax=Paludihabitans sp. MB14-C6 TaxID=3070656 RepID=UPI0027DE6DF6|nr:diacylglycerol kinase family protein [Paludicola sp. MB14-C6]WMJ23408.1 diacylglycerol kinase family protein [Paludicola sp. MB14-C6]
MIRKDFKELARSFVFAFKGIAYCVKNERNMRIHLCMAVFVTLFSYLFGVSYIEYLILIICIAIVITGEMVNTAIETLTNLESPSYHYLAKIAKDVAAGAVFIAASVSVVVGIVIFFKPQQLWNTLLLIFTNPLNVIILIILLILSFLFIFNGTQLVGEPKTKIYHMKNYDNNNMK